MIRPISFKGEITNSIATSSNSVEDKKIVDKILKMKEKNFSIIEEKGLINTTYKAKISGSSLFDSKIILSSKDSLSIITEKIKWPRQTAGFMNKHVWKLNESSEWFEGQNLIKTVYNHFKKLASLKK